MTQTRRSRLRFVLAVLGLAVPVVSMDVVVPFSMPHSAVPVPAAAMAPAAATLAPAAIAGSLPISAIGYSMAPPVFAAASRREYGDMRAAQARAFPPASGFVLNDEGVYIMDRAADTYREIRRLVDALGPHMDLTSSLDVMDETIAEARAKLLAIEAIAKKRQISDANTHLESTLTWVDGTMNDGGRRIAVHTHKVFFHTAPEGPLKADSETEEGIRRVGSYLAKAKIQFAPGGHAEAELGPLDEVILPFDSRGYPQIKDHLRGKESEFKAKFGDRIRFAYVDELTGPEETVEQVRDDYNRLVEKYKDDPKGLQKIMEGVMFSRYAGLLLELKTLEYYHKRHFQILQSGRDLFGHDGKYITEFDCVVKSPDGRLYLVEAKSARVPLPFDEVLRDKIDYKLDIYKKNRALIEETIGGPLNVVFSVDVGGRLAIAAKKGQLVWQDVRQKELMERLQEQAPILSARDGFPVSFLFINSHPGEDPLLFYREPVELGPRSARLRWEDGPAPRKPKAGRKNKKAKKRG